MIWQIISFILPPNEYGSAIDLHKMPILAKKKIIFSNKAHFDLGGYVNNKIVAFGAQKIRTHTLKSRRTQNESLFGADFNSEA